MYTYPYFWNKAMYDEITMSGVEPSTWLLRTMRGSFDVRTTYVGGSQATVYILGVLRGSRGRASRSFGWHLDSQCAPFSLALSRLH